MWGVTPGENEKKRSQQVGADGVLDLGTDLEKWLQGPSLNQKEIVRRTSEDTVCQGHCQPMPTADCLAVCAQVPAIGSPRLHPGWDIYIVSIHCLDP